MSTFIPYFAFLIAACALACALRSRRHLLNQLEDLTSRIENARAMVRRRGDLANEIAHEIKNPLTAILCSAEALDLMIGEGLEESHRKSLRYIREYGKNLLQLLSDFLDVHRAEAGQIRKRPERVDICGAIESVVGLLSESARIREVHLNFVQPQDRFYGFIDPKHFSQIVFNLVHNAIKFTPRNGTVRISGCLQNNFLCISVRDSGIGIPHDRLSTIFDPYSRYDGELREYDAGVGLGLALSKALIELAGGEIAVTSECNKGSEFSVTVPLWRGTADEVVALQEHQCIKSKDRPLRGKRFLVVNEDVGTREAISSLIAAWGGMVDQVAQAADAVEALARKSYDTVMIDEGKELLSVQEFARLVKEDIRSDISIVVSTDLSLSLQGANDPAIDRVIAKPVDSESLLRSLLPKEEIAH